MPEADLLLHAGDLTYRGEKSAIQKFNVWLQDQPYAEKILIAGNHDFLFETHPQQARALIPSGRYLEDSGIVFRGLRIWGTPYQPWFFDWAFNIRSEDELAKHFQLIPEGTDIILAHSPPYGILDQTAGLYGPASHAGSRALLEAIHRVKPKLVVFGHIHEAYGIEKRDGITFVNASICNLRYEPVHKPVVVEIK